MKPFWSDEHSRAITDLLMAALREGARSSTTLSDGAEAAVADVDVLDHVATAIAVVLPAATSVAPRVETRVFELRPEGWRMGLGGAGPLPPRTELDDEGKIWRSLSRTTCERAYSASVVMFRPDVRQVVVHHGNRGRLVDLLTTRGLAAVTWPAEDPGPSVDVLGCEGRLLARIKTRELFRQSP